MTTGLFLSRGGGTISAVLDVDALAARYDQAVTCRVVDSFYEADAQEELLALVKREGLKAVVLAGESVQSFEHTLSGPRFIEDLDAAGVPTTRISFANLAEHVAWAHSGEPAQAAVKARLLIDTALAKAARCHIGEEVLLTPRRAVLVIGGGRRGLAAAKQLLDLGLRVMVVDSAPEPAQWPDPGWMAVLADLRRSPSVDLWYGTRLVDVKGWCGGYETQLAGLHGADDLRVGGFVVCTDDPEVLGELQSLLQMDLDDAGLPRSPWTGSLTGKTHSPGVWFVPPTTESEPRQVAGATSGPVLALVGGLFKPELRHTILMSEVDAEVCGGCGTCVKTCAFHAASIDSQARLSHTDMLRCKGCGNCVTSCPTGARDLIAYPSRYVLDAIDLLASERPDPSEPAVLAAMCAGCGTPAANAAARDGLPMAYSANIMPLTIECGGAVDTQYVLHAFAKGFDGVALCVCRDNHCHHVVGNLDMERRLSLFRDVLRSRRINPERLRTVKVGCDDGEGFRSEMAEFTEDLRTYGPLGMRRSQ
ncbi:MAG: hydrogenase iron-sulfur subunit [Armatimonadetes bacterium]|nr:hydrogenase iron-sulfur subunit [Armatimonadota bacterium]